MTENKIQKGTRRGKRHECDKVNADYAVSVVHIGALFWWILQHSFCSIISILFVCTTAHPHIVFIHTSSSSTLLFTSSVWIPRTTPVFHLSINPSIYPTIHHSIYPTSHPCFHSFINPSNCLSINPSIHQWSIHPSIRPTVYPSIRQASPSIHLQRRCRLFLSWLFSVHSALNV